MIVDPAFDAAGQFYKGNLHTHSNRSDGARSPAEVCSLYREAAYDFVALTDHFLEKYRFPIVDTREYRTNRFTTLLGAEVHAPETALGETWHILAVGLPLDFPATGPKEAAPALAARCLDVGAYVALAHPAWYALTVADAETIPGADAVEIYNHTSAVRTDRGDGWALADQLHARGRRIAICATDDAHLYCNDAFGGWFHVKAERNQPEPLLAALKAGQYYSSQGPQLHSVVYEEEAVSIECSPAAAVMVLGRGSRATQLLMPGQTRVRLPLERVRSGGFARVVVVNANGRRAWTNPVWL
jgi:hypothetical protein